MHGRTALDAATEITAAITQSASFNVPQMAKLPEYFNAIFAATLAAKLREDQLSAEPSGK